MSDKNIREASLEYHRQFPPGKIALQATKQLTNQHDLGWPTRPASRPRATRSSAIRARSPT